MRREETNMISILWFFVLTFLVGFAIPFLFIRMKVKWILWVPAILFLIVTVLLFIKTSFFPGEGMRELGERVYIMWLGMASFGSFIGAVIARLLKK